MVTLRKSEERGKFDFGWLQTFHSFSFADYMDPNHMGFSSLRVINEDRIAAGAGFPTHSHQNMEIVTYVLDGVLEHKDSLGNGTQIRPGEIQRMSAGSGIRHSEFNHLKDGETHLYQIWILPNVQGVNPSYEQIQIDFKLNQLTLIASGVKTNNSVLIYQDVEIKVGKFTSGQSFESKLDAKRKYWIQILEGRMELNGIDLSAGDGASFVDESSLKIKTGEMDAHFLFFNLPS